MSGSELQASKGAKQRAQVGAKLEKNLLAYAAVAGAAGVGLLAATPTAEAKVVYTATNQKIQWSVALDLNGDGVIDFNLTQWGANTSVGAFNYLMVCHEELDRFSHQCISSTGQANSSNLVRVVQKDLAAELAAGAKIGPGPQWGGKGKRVTLGGEAIFQVGSGSYKTTWYGAWMNDGKGVTNRYLGLKFKIGSDFHYGWARVTVARSGKEFSATLTGYAYETVPGKAIVAGATTGAEEVAMTAPVDSVNAPLLGMFALGARGLELWRRDEGGI